MTRLERKYHAAAFVLFAGSILHLLIMVLAFDGWAIYALTMAVIQGGAGFGLMRGWRFAGYLGFVAVLVGAVVAFGAALPGAGILAAAFWVLLVVQVLSVVLLLGLLWRNPRADVV